MKRFFVFLLSLIMVFTFIIGSVSASSIDSFPSSYRVDVTPYFPVLYYKNLTGSNVSNLAKFPSEQSFGYIDILVRTDSTSFRCGTPLAWLSVVNIEGNLWRVYGYLNPNQRDEVKFSFENYNGSWFEILKVEVTPVDYIVNDVSINCRITGTYEYRLDGVDHVQSIDYTTVLSSNKECFTPLLDYSASHMGNEDVFLTCNLSFNWKRFDYFELYIHNAFPEISDYAFYVDGINVV